MKVLITGKNGQLGSELQKTCPSNIELICFGSKDLDISNVEQVNELLISHSPDIVINAAAYTAVDKAETDVGQAYAVNKQGAANLASTCKHINAKLLHISTDFVFDGTSTLPYTASDATNPLGVYGASKLAGEQAINEALGSQAIIVRTAWVYSVFGNNFVKTMLRLMSEKEQLGIVGDQVGTPTWAAGLADMLWALVAKTSDNTINEQHSSANNSLILNWTDAGVASWYDFAVAIQELAVEQGLLSKAIPISAIPAASYPTPAKRPAFSVLNKAQAEELSGVKTVHWRAQLKAMLTELKAQA
ncbi:dTDP-4-dehydrorhamnose reductase [Pseudoalteromonas distincta]|uniref:dTDP-4-dehydrorhamnose reductase n=1 Tax=Pseudoalteromonas distincta TaxID=77608 RepID=A0ABT9GAZ8_9GAMM|nr:MULTISPECIES: dTDP-4-dehydrorhamnose reductase [Pseudoalteromonas distincta group]KHM50105.1 dTDP-4-dehydrorhamnose reductase [Pseudoalteromonas elyakovii]KID40834.1 dTDP-4-dehydrorhamnose reductase [Pseudoalteromonas distincta]MDP4482834.1 dTDP-4-dehydrorhamnose reductase [Pseudoalteromonas elyakovii]